MTQPAGSNIDIPYGLPYTPLTMLGLKLTLQARIAEIAPKCEDMQHSTIEMAQELYNSKGEKGERENYLLFASQVSHSVETDLQKLKRASKKMKEGTYGWCERCHRPIFLDRLKSQPGARTCVTC